MLCVDSISTQDENVRAWLNTCWDHQKRQIQLVTEICAKPGCIAHIHHCWWTPCGHIHPIIAVDTYLTLNLWALAAIVNTDNLREPWPVLQKQPTEQVMSLSIANWQGPTSGNGARGKTVQWWESRMARARKMRRKRRAVRNSGKVAETRQKAIEAFTNWIFSSSSSYFRALDVVGTGIFQTAMGTFTSDSSMWNMSGDAMMWSFSRRRLRSRTCLFLIGGQILFPSLSYRVVPSSVRRLPSPGDEEPRWSVGLPGPAWIFTSQSFIQSSRVRNVSSWMTKLVIVTEITNCEGSSALRRGNSCAAPSHRRSRTAGHRSGWCRLLAPAACAFWPSELNEWDTVLCTYTVSFLAIRHHLLRAHKPGFRKRHFQLGSFGSSLPICPTVRPCPPARSCDTGWIDDT